MTSDQLDPSAQAPCTRTTFFTGSALDAAEVMTAQSAATADHTRNLRCIIYFPAFSR